MKRSDIRPWLPRSERDSNGAIRVETPEGEMMECDPFRLQVWLKDCLGVLCAAAWAKLTIAPK